jgi:hypothetical protein
MLLRQPTSNRWVFHIHCELFPPYSLVCYYLIFEFITCLAASGLVVIKVLSWAYDQRLIGTRGLSSIEGWLTDGLLFLVKLI